MEAAMLFISPWTMETKGTLPKLVSVPFQHGEITQFFPGQLHLARLGGSIDSCPFLTV
jgi:hypothetical protein